MFMRTFRALLLVFVCSLSLPSLSFAEPVNLNTADVATLASLQGIGPAKAKAIVAYRNQNGPFTSVEQLLEVKGIGNATLEKNRADLLVQSSGSVE
ncbi:ComEA family DNA-binding protein [Pontibacter sp. JAM-7]|uniref:ComEA family DNA-binding protein n=1 Tax=Pontibacter sp. JAM-7 TaxID=3366581 RepID=UPI003AF485FC